MYVCMYVFVYVRMPSTDRRAPSSRELLGPPGWNTRGARRKGDASYRLPSQQRWDTSPILGCLSLRCFCRCVLLLLSVVDLFGLRCLASERAYQSYRRGSLACLLCYQCAELPPPPPRRRALPVANTYMSLSLASLVVCAKSAVVINTHSTPPGSSPPPGWFASPAYRGASVRSSRWSPLPGGTNPA